jgi:hypothetical protein
MKLCFDGNLYSVCILLFDVVKEIEFIRLIGVVVIDIPEITNIQIQTEFSTLYLIFLVN